MQLYSKVGAPFACWCTHRVKFWNKDAQRTCHMMYVKCEICEMWNVKCELWIVKCEMWKVKSKSEINVKHEEKWNVKFEMW